jgi:hypothetical protein
MTHINWLHCSLQLNIIQVRGQVIPLLPDYGRQPNFELYHPISTCHIMNRSPLMERERAHIA